MRGMRGFQWYYLLFALPVIAFGFGAKYFVSKHFSAPKTAEKTAQVEKVHENREAKSEKPGHSSIAGDSEKFEAALDATLKEPHHPEKSSREVSSKSAHEDRKDEALHETVAKGESKLPKSLGEEKSSMGGDCGAVEYSGDGPLVPIVAQQWDQVLAQYAEVKKGMLELVQRNRKGFSEKTYAFIEKQILDVKLQKPLMVKEPDLAWRGIGVLEHEGREGKETVIHLGSGFMELARNQPARAKFELARLVAQSIAPCELAKNGGVETWEPLLKCMQVYESNVCGAGSFSEGGWAVSSALATLVAPPGCTVPAFKNPEIAACLKKLPLRQNAAVALEKSKTKELWKESHR